jgi:hypothetical protein
VTERDVMAFVRRHGVVLMAAKGPVPRLTEWIAGEPIRGSWWAHAKGREIYAQLSKISDSPDILTCRLIEGHVTFVHRRLWPALVRLADRFPRQAISAIRDVHTASGKHVTESTPFPAWVPPKVLLASRRLEPQAACEALRMFPELASRVPPGRRTVIRPRRLDQPGASKRSARNPKPLARQRSGKSRAASKRRRPQRRR